MAKILYLYNTPEELGYEKILSEGGHDVQCVKTIENFVCPLTEFDSLFVAPSVRCDIPLPKFKAQTNYAPLIAEIDRAVKAYDASTVKLKSYKNDH